MGKFEKLDNFRRILAREGDMRADGLVYADDTLWEDLDGDPCLDQVRNVATLPGIVGRSLAMPDIHWGYGFPIGGVAAFDLDQGVISPGGVGFDVNCGVRLLSTNLDRDEVVRELPRLSDALYGFIPSGVGSRRADLALTKPDLDHVLARGASFFAKQGLAEDGDLDNIEANGVLLGADPDQVTARAKDRGRSQLGTVGSGNHFVEVGVVDAIYDAEAAAAFGLRHNQITVIIHTGSRGLGYQVCDDNLKLMAKAAQRYGITLPDRQLAAVPFRSPEGQAYFAQMCAAANFAFANRQVITHWAREAFQKALRKPCELSVVYDVCHNIAKVEEHTIDGVTKKVCVHRKGATRAFPAGHPELPERYRAIGQPVMIPGDMGRCSYVMVGTSRAMEETFGSCCHGAGRVLSRQGAKRKAHGRDIIEELLARGIHVRAQSLATVVEEMPEAYKDVSQVVDVADGAGIARKVARLLPLAVIKG